MNPSAPSRVTSTASRTVPKPVMTIGDDVGIAGERLVEDLPAVDARQPQVGDQDVERKLVQPLERLFARAGLLDPEPVLAEPLRDDLAERRFVVDEQQVLEGVVMATDFDTSPDVPTFSARPPIVFGGSEHGAGQPP